MERYLMNQFRTYTKFAIGDVHGSMKYLHALIGKCLAYAEKQQTLPISSFSGTTLIAGLSRGRSFHISSICRKFLNLDRR